VIAWTHDGWYAAAQRRPAHAGRIGGSIWPFGVVIHSTDCPPESFSSLVRSWTTTPGSGSCAHFLIGRTESDGLIQLVSIRRNANHAGGPSHGVWRRGGFSDQHPNLCSIGIELHLAGGVRQLDGGWRLWEDGRPVGALIPAAEVRPDPARAGRGWHLPSAYQLAVLGRLLDDLESVLAPVPRDAWPASSGELAPAYARGLGPRVTTHATLDPARRADPWPPVCEWLRARQQR
jgi:hypothetical protein